MYKVIRAKTAREDIKNIARFIAKDNPYRAISFTQELLEKTEKTISLFPNSGSSNSNTSYIPYENYLIFYDVNESSKTVCITHIINSAQYSAYKNLKN
ncbi:MAG: type II toxin-antitoxin system RelE/ParE family toxin [Colwellia sp.]